jgi:hypothetical protein
LVAFGILVGLKTPSHPLLRCIPRRDRQARVEGQSRQGFTTARHVIRAVEEPDGLLYRATAPSAPLSEFRSPEGRCRQNSRFLVACRSSAVREVSEPAENGCGNPVSDPRAPDLGEGLGVHAWKFEPQRLALAPRLVHSLASNQPRVRHQGAHHLSE